MHHCEETESAENRGKGSHSPQGLDCGKTQKMKGRTSDAGRSDE